MTEKCHNHEVAAELVFDVKRASEDIEFLGLIAGLEEPDNELTGLFDWTCRACTFSNRSSAIIEPEHAFLARWLCTSCGQMTLVRFRSRPGAEWVAQHTLAIAGATLDTQEEPAAAPGKTDWKAMLSASRGQMLFALVTIPALLLIILLASSDLRSVAARVSGRGQPPGKVAPSSRLPGYWVSETGDHSLYFGRIDAATKKGTYVQVFKDRKPCPWVHFVVVREELNGVEVAIREVDEHGNPKTPSDTILYLPQEDKALIRASIAQEHPVLTVYHPIGYKPGR